MDRRTVAIAGAVAVVVVLLVSIGIGIGSHRGDAPAARSSAPEATPETATRAAVDVVTTMLDGTTIAASDPRTAMAELLSPDLLDRWAALATQANTDLIDPLGGSLAVAGHLAVVRTWALSTHVTDFDPDGSATVQIWTLSIAEGSMKPDSPRTLGWRTATVDLAWTDGRWMATDVNFAGGPVPGGDPQTPSSPASVVRAALGEPWS